MRNAPLPEGMVDVFPLSMLRTSECMANAFFFCLDIFMTNKSCFTLSLKCCFY